MVVNIRGDKTHELVDNALTVLENMSHRGAEGADGKSGDGAGIMVQIPHEFILLQGIPSRRRGATAPAWSSCPRTPPSATASWNPSVRRWNSRPAS